MKMSSHSNNRGRAYEYALLLTLKREISKTRSVNIIENSSYFAAKNAWDIIEIPLKETYRISAEHGVTALFDFEPLILEDGKDTLELKIQSDSEGKSGDVRDILIIRRGIMWEIGLSVKHNHFAVKHSRLSKNIDFGEKWFGIRCSDQYWNDVEPIFNKLETEKSNNRKWSQLLSKENDVYVPLLQAFVNELMRSYKKYGKKVPKKMVEYLLGKFDFYKIICIDGKRTTQIQAFNLRGTLNNKAAVKIPISVLPTRIISADFKPDSKNTIELYLDNGWQFGFRIHNASTFVETSLKFDVQIIGMPATIISVNCIWGEKT